MATFKSRVALYQKLMSPGAIHVEIFILVSETAQVWYYALLLIMPLVLLKFVFMWVGGYLTAKNTFKKAIH